MVPVRLAIGATAKRPYIVPLIPIALLLFFPAGSLIAMLGQAGALALTTRWVGRTLGNAVDKMLGGSIFGKTGGRLGLGIGLSILMLSPYGIALRAGIAAKFGAIFSGLGLTMPSLGTLGAAGGTGGLLGTATGVLGTAFSLLLTAAPWLIGGALILHFGPRTLRFLHRHLFMSRKDREKTIRNMKNQKLDRQKRRDLANKLALESEPQDPNKTRLIALMKIAGVGICAAAVPLGAGAVAYFALVGALGTGMGAAILAGVIGTALGVALGYAILRFGGSHLKNFINGAWKAANEQSNGEQIAAGVSAPSEQELRNLKGEEWFKKNGETHRTASQIADEWANKWKQPNTPITNVTRNGDTVTIEMRDSSGRDMTITDGPNGMTIQSHSSNGVPPDEVVKMLIDRADKDFGGVVKFTEGMNEATKYALYSECMKRGGDKYHFIGLDQDMENKFRERFANEQKAKDEMTAKTSLFGMASRWTTGRSNGETVYKRTMYGFMLNALYNIPFIGGATWGGKLGLGERVEKPKGLRVVPQAQPAPTG